MNILLTENQIKLLLSELSDIQEQNEFYFDPTTISDVQWRKITRSLTKMGYESRPFTDWKKYFLRLGPRNISHEDHIVAIKDAIKEKSERTNEQKIITKAKRYFGITNNFESAGYLLVDGSLLNFSGNKFGSFGSTRQLDHRQINQIGVDMIEFMAMGNIRLQSYGIDITQLPTKHQIKTLKWFFSNIKESIIIDFSHKGTYSTEYSIEYPERTNIHRIINDIIHYYQEGIRPVPKIIEEQNDSDENDFYDLLLSMPYKIFMSIKHQEKIKFSHINPYQYKKALDEFIKYGRFVRFPEKIVYKWKFLIMYNTALLNALTDIHGHSSHFPFDEFYDVFEISEDEHDYDFYKAYDVLENYNIDDYVPFFSNGQPVLSDYGLQPIMRLINELINQNNPNDIIVTINKILDVVHLRSDLAEIFIHGGSVSLTKISNDTLRYSEGS